MRLSTMLATAAVISIPATCHADFFEDREWWMCTFDSYCVYDSHNQMIGQPDIQSSWLSRPMNGQLYKMEWDYEEGFIMASGTLLYASSDCSDNHPYLYVGPVFTSGQHITQPLITATYDGANIWGVVNGTNPVDFTFNCYKRFPNTYFNNGGSGPLVLEAKPAQIVDGVKFGHVFYPPFHIE